MCDATHLAVVKKQLASDDSLDSGEMYWQLAFKNRHFPIIPFITSLLKVGKTSLNFHDDGKKHIEKIMR